jgi:hypothetical protein
MEIGDRANFAPGIDECAMREPLERRQTATIFVADHRPPGVDDLSPGPAAMASTVKALFALATVAAVSIGLLLPVPGAVRQSLDARGHYELMDVGARPRLIFAGPTAATRSPSGSGR